MVLRNSGRVGSRRFSEEAPSVDKDTEALFVFGGLINFYLYLRRTNFISTFKANCKYEDKIFIGCRAVAFSFAVTSCGNKKAADSNATEADSCCAAKTEQVCDSAKACCQAADSAACPKAACDGAKCNKPCEKK